MGGTRDAYLPEIKRTYESLKERGYPIVFEEYVGGHDIKAEALMKLF